MHILCLVYIYMYVKTQVMYKKQILNGYNDSPWQFENWNNIILRCLRVKKVLRKVFGRDLNV